MTLRFLLKLKFLDSIKEISFLSSENCSLLNDLPRIFVTNYKEFDD